MAVKKLIFCLILCFPAFGAITQFDTENADRDLTSQVTVLTDTPDAADHVLAIGLIYLGDGVKDLDGTGGLFELTVTVGGQTVEPDPQIIYCSTATRTGFWTSSFPVPSNNEVIFKLKSPNAADTDVDTTAYLFEAAASISDPVNANITQISGDSTAADNLESQYDTTGLAGDTFPATQAQLGNLANVGTGVGRTPSSYTLTTGTQSSGTVSSTEELDGTNHEHTDNAGVMDLYYEFIIGSGIPDEVIMTGYLNGNNDDLEVYGYDWVSAGWKQIGTLEGKAQSTNEVDDYKLFINMVGSGADEGKVRVRFTDGAFTLTTATLAIDQIYLSFALGTEGYDNGAIWINTNVTNTNTVVGIDGTARNPVSTMAAANTLAASTNLDHFEIAPNSSITFAASQENQTFNGEIWTLALGGQSISGTHIIGADVSGICTGASEPRFFHCHFTAATTLPPSDVESSFLASTITAGSAGNFFFEKCNSAVAGTNTPVFDFGSGLNASNLNFRIYSGGIEIRNMGAGTGTYNMSLEGFGQLVINANCSATSTVAIRGHFTVTDNASGVTLSDDAAFDHHELIDLMTLQNTTVKDANDANNFTVEDARDVNDAHWFAAIQVEDADTGLREIRWIDQYDENSTDPNIWVDEPFSFTPAVGDNVYIMGTAYGGYLYRIMRKLDQTKGVLNVVDQTRSGTGGLDRAGAIRIDALGDDP